MVGGDCIFTILFKTNRQIVKLNYKYYAILLFFSFSHPASLYPADFVIRSSSFNASGGITANKDFKNSYTLAEAVIPHGGASSLFKVKSGFINTLPIDNIFNRNDLVFNQSVEVNEDEEIAIELKGVELVESFLFSIIFVAIYHVLNLYGFDCQ